MLILENGDRFTSIGTESTISLVFTSINIISCLYVLSRLYSIRRINGAVSKYPFCFAITYLTYSIMQIVHIFINHSSLSRPGIFCGILGKFYPTFLNANLLLIGFLGFSTLSKIIEKINIETGKYDIYMWQGMFLLSWFASIFGVNRYEPFELKYHR